MTDPLISIGAELLSIMAAVWTLTEIIGAAHPALKDHKSRIALVLGPAFGVVAYALGFLTTLPACHWRGCTWVAAAFAGFICTLITRAAHDGIVSPILDRLKTPPAPPAGP